MNEDNGTATPPPSPRPAPTPALSRRALLGLAATVGVGAANVGAFAYAADLLPEDRLTPARFVDRFERVAGKHTGFRRNHAKGVSVSGHFVARGGREVSKAAVFEPGRTTPVTGRFSVSGGAPDVADANPLVRGLGLLFDLPNGEQWRTAMINTPVFLDSTPQGFYDRILAAKPLPATGKPDPRRMADFLAAHPETAAAMAYNKKHPPTSGFDDSTFYGLNAFRFTNAAGTTVPVRWSLTPLQPTGPGNTGEGNDADKAPSKNHLFDTLIAKLAEGPLRWRLMLTVGHSGDPTHDATRPWPADRRKIDAGTLTLDAVHTEAEGNGRDVNFDPLVLPDGIAGSDDPLLSARSAVYSQSYKRRAGESKQPSPVDVSKVLQ
ncbi:catalase family peroxidase [Streptomyces sp. NPDC047117]|uniref:catalase family peroxidase n=1 Tax=Streptomyces sp. NPDC047117 TaxID=3155379 RepID=UPI0033D241FD